MELLHKSAKAWKDYPEHQLYEEHFLSPLSGNIDDEYIVEEFEKIEKPQSTIEELLKDANFSSSTVDQGELIATFNKAMNPPLSNEENPTLNTVFGN